MSNEVSDNVREYTKLLFELELARLEPTYNIEVECDFVERLGDIWRLLTPEEQEQAETCPSAPQELNLVDVELPLGATTMARKTL